MTEKIAAYTAALQALEAAKNQADALVSQINDAAGKLRRNGWKNMVVTEALGINFPPEMINSSATPKLNARAWPTGDQIARALSDYHIAFREMNAAYVAIPGDQKGTIKAPPVD